ncbi:MAG: DUF4430 domain-containing protein [Ruminococcaceae bacterium]|nr:DUF4430 domain-containing protein [Oscillospiraceae bacterium]
MKKITAIFVCLLLVFTLCACSSNEATGLWKDAVYQSDKTFGEGSKTVVVEVKAEDKSVNFTINSDEKYLGAALLQYELISGEDSEYGLYIKSVNGIVADYDVDKSYWAFYKNGEYMMSGVDTTEFANGEHYELVHSK